MNKSKVNDEIQSISEELRNKPYLFEFMKSCVSLSKEERMQVIQRLRD